MKRFCGRFAAAMVLAGSVLATPASAVPPTATPSPGYDARLQQSQSGAPSYLPQRYAPARRHVRRHRSR
jgi:hypothetical protein